MIEDVSLDLFRGASHAIQDFVTAERAGCELLPPIGSMIGGHFVDFALPGLVGIH